MVSGINLRLEGRWAGLYTYPDDDAKRFKTDGESVFTVYADKEEGQTKIHGEGQDKSGPFSFKGHVSHGTTVTFIKDYKTHSWHYSGAIDLETNMMYGRWGAKQEGGTGYFAFHLVNRHNTNVSAEERLQSITGSWSGAYTRKGSDTPHSCDLKLRGAKSQMDDQLTIQGTGNSPNKFEIEGVVSPSGQVAFAKIFSHNIYLYRGVLTEDNTRMTGEWAGSGVSGGFDFSKDV
ncbi:hypothetical protein GGS23DRAFT_613047 [Durotheca rogersii]|uniref:uncharacterized protein n=1 Tax=Durotheca rogersii TaxID=419775 RepID=UPI002220D738|nr:uncharacterized protein GGS23DRAFT_613047 [Durotheca rogersii]KAI5867878.1 hypothetical protein GGS23DRAFT_613047 [Durotheca rogersii]